MLAESITCSSDSSSYVKELLEIPERPELLRLAALAGYVFRAPVAYLAIVDHTSKSGHPDRIG